jgi:hypothetical protein
VSVLLGGIAAVSIGMAVLFAVSSLSTSRTASA